MKGTLGTGRERPGGLMLGKQEAEPRLHGRGRSSGSLSTLRLPRPGPLTLLSLVKVALETYPDTRIAGSSWAGWGSDWFCHGKKQAKVREISVSRVRKK